MADTRGCWSLSEAWAEKAAAEWVPIPNVWLPNDGFGYSMWQNTQKLTRTNIETGLAYSSPDMEWSGTYPSGRWNANSSFSSPSYGYWGGGDNTNGLSWVSKVTYSTGIHEDGLPNMAAPVYESGSISAGEKSYVFAGVWAGNSRSYTQRMTYSDETWAQLPSSNTSYNEWYLCGVNSGSGTGYSMGGPYNTPGNSAKITFANDSWSYVPSGFQRTYYGTGKLRTNTNSWYTGGFINTPSQPFHRVSTTNKFTYSNETWAVNPTAQLPIGLTYSSSYPYNSAKGCLCGGVPQGSSPYKNSQAYTLTFATDTWDATSIAADSDKFGAESGHNSGVSAAENLGSNAGIDGSKRWLDGVGESQNFGIFCGGDSSSGGSAIDKLDFSSETVTTDATFPGSLNLRNSHFGSSATKGYLCMGRIPSWPWNEGVSTCYKYTYATDTLGAATPYFPSSNAFGRGYDGVAVDSSTATTLSNMGGQAQGGYPDAHRVTHATDATSAVPGLGPDSTAPTWGGRNETAAASNIDANNAYWTGGQSPNSSATQKVLFASDTRQNLPGSPYPFSVYGHRGVGGPSAGYFANGYSPSLSPSYSTVMYKFSWASETFASAGTMTGIDSTNGRFAAGATGNKAQGYFFGGSNANSNVDKIVYASDTISHLSGIMPSNNPSNYRRDINAGATSPLQSNNTAAAVAPVATPTSSTTLTGPQGIKAEGYLIQGIQGSTSGSGRSDVYRLNYNTDTWDSSVFANSTLTRKRGGAASTTTAAYVGGGGLGSADGSSPTGGDMDKLTYATSTMSRIPGSDAGGIPGKSTDAAAAGNQTQGYWTFGTGDQSGCDKLVYSTETAAALPNLPWNAKNTVAVSMQTAGYYGSGDGFDDENTSFTRITFSNDTYATYSGWFYTPGGFAARYRCGSSSSTKAYIVGGQNAPRCMDVTPWATNSTSNSPTTFLQAPGFYKAPGQGSNEAGYFTGGGNVGNNGTTTEKITYASDTTAIVPSAYFNSSSPSGINSYSTGGPNMNGLGTNIPNVI